jgi:hypothetical protein
LRDRSGAIEGLEDVVRVAVAMGGESTHQRVSIKPNPLIHLYLDLRSRRIEAPGRSRPVFAGVLTVRRLGQMANRHGLSRKWGTALTTFAIHGKPADNQGKI